MMDEQQKFTFYNIVLIFSRYFAFYILHNEFSVLDVCKVGYILNCSLNAFPSIYCDGMSSIVT